MLRTFQYSLEAQTFALESGGVWVAAMSLDT